MTDLGLHYSNRINCTYLEDLRSIFYFNKDQKKYHSKIIEVVEKYGEPQIIIDSRGFVTFYLDKCPNAKTLFTSTGPTFLGVLIYKQNEGYLEVLHAAFERKNKNHHSSKLIFIRSLEYLAEINNIRKIKILYSDSN
jgi:hypothetical protein